MTFLRVSQGVLYFVLFIVINRDKYLILCTNPPQFHKKRNKKNMVKGEILYCTLFPIDPCNVSQIKSSSRFIPLLCLEMIQDRWQRRKINGVLHDIMLTTIVDPIMQHYEKGHASKTVRLLLIHSINNDILYSRSADGQPRKHQETHIHVSSHLKLPELYIQTGEPENKTI